jgi:hypothetical protein
VNVPGGEPLRNCAKGILTAPFRNCSTATLAESENIPPGRSKTSAAKSSGRHERISFNGNAIMSPVGAALRMGAGAGDVAAGLGAGAAAGGPDGLGGGAGMGAGTDSSFTGAAAGGGLDGLENNLLKTPNINRVVVHTARTHSARR